MICMQLCCIISEWRTQTNNCFVNLLGLVILSVLLDLTQTRKICDIMQHHFTDVFSLCHLHLGW